MSIEHVSSKYITNRKDTLIPLGLVEPGTIKKGELSIFLHEDTGELVFMTRDDNNDVRFARLPLNMGPPLGFTTLGVFPTRTLNMTTSPHTLDRITSLRPIYGMNYEPSPSDYTSLPPPAQYGDTDFSNSDFQGLWGNTLVPGAGTCTIADARDDIGNMRTDLNTNYVRFFNLNQEAFRDHIPFADYCDTNNVSVTWPLDFWVTSVSSGSWPNPFRELVITLIKTLGVHPATAAWRLGNELNGTTEANNIATIFELIVQNDPGKHPVSSSLQAGTFPGMATSIKNAILAKNLKQEYEDLWFQMVNVYPLQSDPVAMATVNLDTMINTTWPQSDFSTQPLLITEYGTACNVSEADQADSIKAQVQFIKNAATNTGKPLFLGGCLFEYTNELWKTTNPGCQQEDLGINKFDTGVFCTAREPSQLNPPNLYRVDTLIQKPAYASYKEVVNS